MNLTDLILERCRNENEAALLADIEALVSEGRDVNEPDDMDMTPLHIAISYSLHDVVQKLLDNGADVDAIDGIFKGTPLHHAVKFENLEIVCMLLCYGADVSIINQHGMTPLMYAIDMNALDIAKVLFDYYDDFSYSNEDGYSALLLATKKRSPLAFDLVMAGANVNCVVAETNFNPLSMALTYDNIDLFYLIWPKFDCKILLDRYTPFLLTYLNSCCFPLNQWLECLYFILDSPFAFQFVEQSRNFQGEPELSKQSLLLHLLMVLHEKKIEQSNRLKLIYILLCLGCSAMFFDLVVAHQHFGFGEEVTALLYVGDYYSDDFDAPKIYLLPTQILLLNEANRANILHALRFQLVYRMYSDARTTLKYFSLNADAKGELLKINRNSKHNHEIVRIYNLIELAQEVPSLMELCRNKIRSTILIKHTFKFPYQFHDVVNSLKLPQLIKDIITFKAPIYK